MRHLLSADFTSTTTYSEGNYYNGTPAEEQTGPSLVLIVGLTMAFIGTTILIVIICCVCRKRQPPDSQGAMYERAATTDGQSTVTAYPLGPMNTGSAPSTQSSTTASKTASTTMSSSGGQPVPPPPQQPVHMYPGPPGHPVYPNYPPNAANMVPPYIYPVPQPNVPMTTLAVFGAPDGGAPPENSQSSSASTPQQYSVYPTGPGEMRTLGQDTLRAQQAYLQDYQRQVPPIVYNPSHQSSEFMRQQATAPPHPSQM